MKRFIFTLIALLILIANLQGQWEILNEGVKGSLNAIDFVNKNVGWIAGSEGLLLQTKDGGQTWHPTPLNKNWSITMIDFLNDSVGWAIGYERSDISEKSIILKTFNGGHTWSIQKSQAGTDSYKSLFVSNDSVVYVAGEKLGNYIMILKTSDGGVNWRDVTPGNSRGDPQSIWFFDSQVGIVTGYSHPSDTTLNAFVWSTQDGGITWEETIISELLGISDLQFIDDSTGYFLARVETESSYYSMLCKTTDRFKTWSIITLSDINSFFYLGNGHFCANIGSSFSRNRGPDVNYISKSVDGGATWEAKLPEGHLFLNQIYFCSDNVGFSLGGGLMSGGNLLKTIDGGENWSFQIFSYSFDNACFFDRDKGFAGGGYLGHIHWGYGGGDVFVTVDGGKTWQQSLSTTMKIESCVFVNTSIGFVLLHMGGGRSSIYKTVDSGENWDWIDIKPDTDRAFEGTDISFLNDQTGWAVGSIDAGGGYPEIPAILKTTDGGENWEAVWLEEISKGRNYLNSIYFVNDSSGWAVGDSGLIVISTEAQWQEKTRITDLPLIDVFFIDKNVGFIAGGYLNIEGYGSILFKTINGGETWNEIPDLSYLIYDIYFHDQQHGWAVGTDSTYSGVILATEDGGVHWAVQVDGLIGDLNSLSYRDGFLWAVGDYGLVLRTNLATAVKDDKDQHLPSAFELSQNYPNPFNTSTAISYQLSAFSQVDLSIYNLLGQKIETLISKQQAAGKYTIEWDASDCASGIYFYRISTPKFTQIKKAVLLR